MATLDWIVLGIFFLGLIGIIVWVLSQKDKDTTDYFLAGKNAGWLSIGSSIFASNIGSEHLVGLAGAGFISGMAMAHWEMHAWFILILGWVFVPFYDRIKIYTMPEFLEKRFSSGSRSILSGISLVSYVLTKVAVTVYAGGVVFDQVFNIESINIFGNEIDFFWVSAIGLVVITGLYTVLGGMKAIMYTSVLQTPVLLFGSIVILIVGLGKVGGWVEVRNIVGDNLHLVRSAADPDFPWTGVLLASACIGFWYWCTDQYIVQRVLSAKNLSNAQSGTILAGFLKILPVFILILPGIIAFYISDGTISGDRTYAWLVTNLLPSGLKGLVVAGLLAALMSSLSAMFNSTSTLLTIDIYKKIKPDADEKSTVAFGRIATGVMVLLGLLWIPFIGILSDDRMYVYLQSVQAYISPPIAAIFLFGIFWKRVNGKGAMASLITGLVLGSFRLIIEIQNKIDPLSNSFLQSIASINFLHFAIFLFIVSSAVLVLVSLSTAKPTADKLEGMIYSRNISVIKDKWRSINVGFSILLLIVLIALWWNFR